ncbi:hypothetical protein TrCOL_g13137 [Triparma columacea]|uniref:Glycerol-3-phosphate dehydrogenase [NAD(+)] n=1 Tax=Triparma columacea TaxID=722753 RepID=A0A9W7G6V9_9STRA|nr:hypothetical protein TrCOL_g13137 [Triparma columacea]
MDQIEKLRTRAAELLASKPIDSNPEALSTWWADWCALGSMIPPNSIGERDAKGSPAPLPDSPAAHWKGWWSATAPPAPSSSSPSNSPDSTNKLKVTVWGGGAFGTAMARCASRNGHNVVMYVRDPEQERSINEDHVNNKYLSNFTLPDNITATIDLKEANAGSSLFIHALPCQLTPKWLAANRTLIPGDVCICSTAKGLYVETRQLLGDAMLAALERPQPLAFLSGPSFAAEIMKGDPSAVVVASLKLYHATAVQKFLSNNSMRVYVSQDVVGVQLGGALKNPLAIGAGMIEGLGLGINTMSAFVTRSCNELRQLCVAMGGKENTISGLSGVGDLMLTCFGNLSRNRTCGTRLVKGEKLEDILKTMTVEGVPTARVCVYYADMCGLDLPIFRCAAAVIDGKMSPEEARSALMSRPLGMEKGEIC